MPIVISPNKLYAKKPDGSGYLSANVISDQTTAEQCAAIEQKGQETIDSIPSDYTNLSNQVGDLKSALNSISEYSATVTDGKYVKYSDGSLNTLSGVKTVSFPVKNGQKIHYGYTISTADNRGLAFFDVNEFYISGNQTLATAQDISVPSNAVLCLATVTDVTDIKISSYNKALNDSLTGIELYLYDIIGCIKYELSDNNAYRNNKSTESSITQNASSNFMGAKVPCEGGDVFYYSGYYDGNSNNRLWSFFDASGNNVGDSGSSTGYQIDGTFTAPAGAKTLYFTTRKASFVPNPYLSKGKKIKDTIVDLQSDIAEYDTVLFGETAPREILVDVSTYTDKTDSGGIDYTWSDNNTKCTVEGTRTGPTFCKFAGSTSSIPSGFTAGETYNVVFHPVDTNIIFQLLYYVNGVNTSNAAYDRDGELMLPSNITGVEFRLTVATGATVDEKVDRPLIYTIPKPGLVERVENLETGGGSSSNPLEVVQKTAGMLSLFHTVGCIGDSLSSGECAYNNGGTTHYIDLYDFSWGQCLARLTGNTYYNFSNGGLTTKTWLEREAGSGFGPNNIHAFDGNHDCDAYFIGLGQNDKNVGMTVGTTADINLSDYTQNADTYCGNYGKIIQKIKEAQPKAPIFCFIDPNPPSGDQSYNAVIPGIVALFTNVWIIDLKTYAKNMFTSPTEIIGSQIRSGHYSALGYQQIAFVIATYVDWIVRNNLSAFSQVEFIGTDYEWTT